MEKNWTQKRVGTSEIWTINRPSASNSLSRAARFELEEMLLSAASDKSMRVVIITGAGEKSFSAGADLSERSGMSEHEVFEWLKDLRRTLCLIESSPVIFVAAVNGAALGGGLELALACDLRVASHNAVFGLPEVRLAIIPGGGGTQRLPRLIGLSRAKDLIFTGRRISVEEALNIGLVDRLATEESGPGGAVEIALSLAQEMAGCGPLALAAAKKAIMSGRDLDLDTALQLEMKCYSELFNTEDRLEGLKAFSEKRTPDYSGM